MEEKDSWAAAPADPMVDVDQTLMFSLWIHHLDADVVVPVKCKQSAGSLVVLFITDFHHVSSRRITHWSFGVYSRCASPIMCSLIVPDCCLVILDGVSNGQGQQGCSELTVL